jgi:hypothetical protein
MADEIDQPIAEFRRRGPSASRAWKLGVVIGVERIPDDRVVPFLVEVLIDDRQPIDLRLHILRRIRNGPIRVEEHARVVAALIPLLRETSNADLRADIILALGALTEVDGVLPLLGGIAMDESLPLDLRYSAFMSLERAGPTEHAIAVLRVLAHDETLGRTARSTLLAWRVAQETSDDDDDD